MNRQDIALNEETAREIAWRLRNISEMLMARGASGERLYGCDGWSTPIANINELLVYVERQAFAGPNA